VTTIEAKKYRQQVERYLKAKARGVKLPGERGLSVYNVGRYLFKEMVFLRLQERVAAVTYNFLMAIPPTLLFLFSLVPYLPLKNKQQAVLNAVKLLSPNKRTYQSVSTIISDFMNNQHHSLLSFGIILTLFYASNGMMGLMKTFDRSMSLNKKSQNLYKKRGSVKRRWTAIRLTVVLIATMVLTIMSLAIQTRQLNFLIPKALRTVFFLKSISFVVLVVVVLLAISTIYRYGPSLTHKFRFFSPGSIFATIASLLATLIFFFLVNNFLHYNKVYGSIGSLMAFMVWVWLNTMIILVGYELNVSILLGKLSNKQKDGPKE
jgi:membrane protein